MVETERAEIFFKAQSYVSGAPWISAEWLSATKIFDGTLGFDLVDGTTGEQAKEIADYMSKHIKSLSLTT
jgi:hypothetical protein